MAVDRERLAAQISKGAALLLDTPVLIAYLEGSQEIAGAATFLLDDWVRGGRNRAFVSAISAMELFVGPLRAQRSVEEYADFLLRFPNVQLVPADVAVAAQAAALRARYGIKPPDALIIATAVTTEADAIVSNDRSWQRLEAKPVILLGDFV